MTEETASNGKGKIMSERETDLNTRQSSLTRRPADHLVPPLRTLGHQRGRTTGKFSRSAWATVGAQTMASRTLATNLAAE